jgi:hypothetical protein
MPEVAQVVKFKPDDLARILSEEGKKELAKANGMPEGKGQVQGSAKLEWLIGEDKKATAIVTFERVGNK